MRRLIIAWLRAYTAQWGGIGVLVAGCPECARPGDWPIWRLRAYAWLIYSVHVLAYVAGSYPTITSAYRCAQCNRRRDGAPRSRHLAMTSGGAPYVAVDVQWDTSTAARPVVSMLYRIPAYIRRATGLDVGVGVIVYPGARRLHLDYRERDYVSDRR